MSDAAKAPKLVIPQLHDIIKHGKIQRQAFHNYIELLADQEEAGHVRLEIPMQENIDYPGRSRRIGLDIIEVDATAVPQDEPPAA